MLSSNSTFSISIGKLVAIAVTVIGAAFTVGMTYQTILPDRALQEKQNQEIQDIKITLAKVTEILANMDEKQKDTSRDIAAIQDRTHSMNAEIQVISSSLKEEDRKRKR